MLKKLLKKWQRKKTFLINKRIVKIKPLTFDEMLEVVFLLLPYLKIIKLAKQEIDEDATPSDIYYDVLHNGIVQMSRTDASRAVMILLHQDLKFVEEMAFKDFQRILPTVVRENDLIETFLHLNSLGLIE
jgi:hypothetical protein